MKTTSGQDVSTRPAHTPGPFRLIPHAGSDEFSVEAGKGQMVANFAGAGPANKANAFLYMAGEDMLDALKDAREELRLLRMKDTQAVYNPGLRAKISLVIAKAERGQ